MAGTSSGVSKEELTCKPLDSYNDVIHFLQHPPPWRSLCRPLKPHSENKIRNMDIHGHYGITHLESPESFCHFNPGQEEVRRSDGKSLPKTLVCHDLANGYHDDSIIDGTGNADSYTFYNWAGIDIFCYFSHHFITIPPLGWINVGHDHGVKVIGTVITEWAEGVALWDRILESQQEYETFATALVDIARTLKLDGWLLNVENKISRPGELLKFVQYLHRALHAELPEPVLVWYDSVTVDGKLNWQNGLNDNNKAFFDACDAFFTNYSWRESDVASSARAAGPRLCDLFVGIDVWGRNFYGGGQFNVQEAIKVAFSYGCSLAIFAPAWTHEAMGEDSEQAVALGAAPGPWGVFVLRERALWGSLWPFLSTRLPHHLPFHTSFCLGRGRKRRLYGEVLCPVPWFNLRHQQYQPNSAHGPHGYLLSTAEHIRGVSNTAFFKDSGGILRYNRSFMQVRAHLMTSQGSVAAEEQGALRRRSVGALGAGRGAGGPRTVLATMKSAFKHIIYTFKKKEDVLSDPQPTTRSVTPTDTQDKEPVEVPTSGIPDDVINAVDTNSDPTPTEAVIDKTKDQKDAKGTNVESKSEDRTEPIGGSEAEGTNELEAVTSDEVVDGEVEEKVEPFTSGQSMVQVPVNLRLGAHNEKTRYGLARVPGELECLEQYDGDSFTGGSCLKLNPSDRLWPDHRLIRLFHCHFLCRHSLVACVVTKLLPGHEEQSLNIRLLMHTAEGGDVSCELVGREPGVGEGRARRGGRLFPLDPTSPKFVQLRKYLLLNEPAFYVPVDNDYHWNVRYYLVRVSEARMTSVVCRTALAAGPILLGHFGLCNVRTDDTVIK